jgi:hypothetical protein
VLLTAGKFSKEPFFLQLFQKTDVNEIRGVSPFERGALLSEKIQDELDAVEGWGQGQV